MNAVEASMEAATAGAGDAPVQAAAPPAGAAPPDGVPVFVMLPLDTVNADGVFKYGASRWFLAALQQLNESGIHGVAVDVWWGAVERRPRRYDWSGYRQLFDLVASLGLKIQVVMAFHACGGNVGDNAEVPLPGWVAAVGERDPDIFFTDRPRESTPGQRNRECVSLFAAEEPGLLKGRSAMQCYADFMRAFRDEFSTELGSLIEEVVVGAGPCGELRYPSYPEPNGWRFPGIGEFQCYDRRALASLARAAGVVGRPEWGNAGPHDAGTYNAGPEETGFFQGWGGRWDTEYGRFFLSWYSAALLDHGDRMLAAAAAVFNVTRRGGAGGGGGSGGSGSPPGAGGPGAAPDTPMSVDGGSSSVDAWPPWRQGSGASVGGSLRGGAGGAGGTGGASTAGDASTGSLEALGTALPPPGAAPPAAAAASPCGPPPGGAPPAAAASSLPDLQQLYGNPPSAVSSPPGSLAGAGPAPGAGGVSRPPSFASFRSSSVSECLNALEDWVWPSPAGPAVALTLKMAGVHWWYRTRSHAAEVTAGYYNVEGRGGYDPIVALCARYGASLTLTCVEMCDAQHPPEALCGPEGLLRQVREAAALAGVDVGGENALPCFMPNVIDEIALQRVVYNTQPWGTPLQQGAGARDGGALPAPSPDALISTVENAIPAGGANEYPPPAAAPGAPGAAGGAAGGVATAPAAAARLPPMRSFTFLRLTPEMVSPTYADKWGRFMALMEHNAARFKTSPRWRQHMGFTAQ